MVDPALEKRKEYFRLWHQKNKKRRLAALRARKNKLKPVLRELVRSRKDGPCADCGQKFPPWVMQFDHVRGKKRWDVASMIGQMCTKKAIEEEIAKCELVCANCHANRTYRRRNVATSRRRN